MECEENAVFQNLPKMEKIGKPHLTNTSIYVIIITIKERGKVNGCYYRYYIRNNKFNINYLF